MTSATNEYAMSERELAYLQHLASVDSEFLRIVKDFGELSFASSKVHMSRPEAEKLRGYFFDRLSQVGFDEAYEPNAEGLVLEALIDKFFVP